MRVRDFARAREPPDTEPARPGASPVSVERELLDALLGGGESDAEDLERTTLMGQLRSELLPFAPQGPLPDPTPAEGPDPYGNPDPEWLRIDWREHLREAEVPGAEGSKTRVNYVELGAGTAAGVRPRPLAAAGRTGSRTSRDFAADHRVLALDLPGFGNSPMPEWAISIEAYGRLLHDFCEALGIDALRSGRQLDGRVHLGRGGVGPSPNGSTRLALVSAAGVSSARSPRARRGAGADDRRHHPGGAEAGGARPAPLEGALGSPSGASSTIRSPCEPSCFTSSSTTATGRPGFLPALQALLGYDILDRLRDVEVPTLIVWGRNDMVVPAGDARAFGQRLRNSTDGDLRRAPDTARWPSGRCASIACSRRSSPSEAR